MAVGGRRWEEAWKGGKVRWRCRIQPQHITPWHAVISFTDTLSLLPPHLSLPYFSPDDSSWIPKDRVTPAACIFLAHGVNEHVSRYNELAHSLTRQGYAGKESSGQRGWEGLVQTRR